MKHFFKISSANGEGIFMQSLWHLKCRLQANFRYLQNLFFFFLFFYPIRPCPTRPTAKKVHNNTRTTPTQDAARRGKQTNVLLRGKNMWKSSFRSQFKETAQQIGGVVTRSCDVRGRFRQLGALAGLQRLESTGCDFIMLMQNY